MKVHEETRNDAETNCNHLYLPAKCGGKTQYNLGVVYQNKIYIFMIPVTQHYFCAQTTREPRSVESDETVVTESPVENLAENNFISNAARAQFEREALNETIIFLNTLFRSQIDYFSKVREFLPATVKRVADINKYIERLQKAILADSVQEKDNMWRDTFVKVSGMNFQFINVL